MDALTHNVESYLSPAYHPICDGIALEGMRLAARALRTAVREPGNLAARGGMMMSSMMGAIAFQKGLGAVHSCAHALGTVSDLHHGLANALMIDTCSPGTSRRCRTQVRRAGARGRRRRRRRGLPRTGCGELKRTIGIAADLGGRGREARAIPRLVEIADRRHLPPDQPAAGHGADFERLFAEAM